jgi:hypothetical protein
LSPRRRTRHRTAKQNGNGPTGHPLFVNLLSAIAGALVVVLAPLVWHSIFPTGGTHTGTFYPQVNVETMPLRTFLTANPDPSRFYKGRNPASTGYVLEVKGKILGLRGKRVLLRWTMDNADTSQPISERGFVDQPAAEVTPSTADDSFVSALWIPLPKNVDRVKVYIALSYGKAPPLDSIASPVLQLCPDCPQTS